MKQLFRWNRQKDYFEQQERYAREEGLAYIQEVIRANRQVKQWMLRNSYYSILLQGGLYFIFKDSKTLIEISIALIFMLLIWVAAFFVLNSNNNTIGELRRKERILIDEVPFPTMKKHSDLGPEKDKRDLRYLIMYLAFILGTGALLLGTIASKNSELRAVAREFFSQFNSETRSPDISAENR